MGDGKEMAAGERLDRRGAFLNSFMPQNAQVRLAIDRRSRAEYRRPINIPVNEYRMGIARDREEKAAAVGTGQFAQVLVVARRGKLRRALFGNDRLAREDEFRP